MEFRGDYIKPITLTVELLVGTSGALGTPSERRREKNKDKEKKSLAKFVVEFD